VEGILEISGIIQVGTPAHPHNF